MDDQNRNLILASALSFLVILVWYLLFPPPEPTPAPQAQVEATAGAPGTAATPGVAGSSPVVGLDSTAPQVRETALAASARLPIHTARLEGSLSLTGGRIDDLKLTDYKETLAADSPLVTLLTPAGAPEAYYTLYGWAPAAGSGIGFDALPGPTTEWQVEGDTAALTEATPVTLVWDNGQGLIFRRTISVDANYMFDVNQTVENRTGAEVRLQPYGIVVRHGIPSHLRNFYILHEGAILAHDGQLQELKYKAIADLEQSATENAAAETVEVTGNGWIGFTDHYWMTTMVPPAGQPFTAVTKFSAASNIFQTDVRMPVMTVAAGATGESKTSLFAGAKEYRTIRDYQEARHIDRFVDAIDWGMFFFLTKPIFQALHYLNHLFGNMGLAIIALTFLIKAVLFPLAYKSYVSMSRMKALQPEMEAIKERAGEDRMKMQQEVMALYKREKVNPAAGCLPIILQIPIFFSLYKVIFVTIELRHAPFFGWIRDLSAPDPTSWMNAFGLLPWAAPDHTSFFGILSIGIWPILLGISMWLQQKLNPAPTDKTQAMVFAYMPLIFTFMLGSFASGLVIYWVANNLITFSQQYLIMRSQGVAPNVFGNITSSLKRSRKAD